MANHLNSRLAAELIKVQTGRDCTRQNLEKLCLRGALQGSPCILRAKPLLVDGDLLVAEYLARVAPHQAEAQQPKAKRKEPPAPPAQPAQPSAPEPPPPRRTPAQLPATAPEGLPDYTVSRARSEFEKANLLQLQREKEEDLLVYREDMEAAQNAVNLQILSRAEALPKQIKLDIPHLTPEEMVVIERRVLEIFESVSAHDFEELPE